MKTVYHARGFMGRQTFSAIILVVVSLYGVFELTRQEFVWGALFIGGAFWAFNQVLNDTRDTVAKLEIGPDGRSVATLWRLTGPVRISTDQPLEQWRYYVKLANRGLRRPFIYLKHPARERELAFELSASSVIDDDFRALAGEAWAEHAANIGEAPDDASDKPAN